MEPDKKKSGELSDVKNADADTQNLCDDVKSDVEDNVLRSYVVFTAKKYRTDLQAQSNYFVKVHVGRSDYLHLRIFQKEPGREAKLIRLQENKSLTDEIKYF